MDYKEFRVMQPTNASYADLFNVIRKLANKEKLSPSETRMSEDVQQKALQSGRALDGQFTFETRSLIDFDKPTLVSAINNNSYDFNLWERLHIYEDIPHTIKLPYVTDSNVAFKAEGNGAEPEFLYSKRLDPKRITARCELEMSALKQTTQAIEQQVCEQLQRAIINKIIAVMLSDCEQTKDTPKGLLNGISATTVNDNETFLDFICEADSISNNYVLLMSPTAKKNLITIDSDLFKCSKFCYLAEVARENRLKDGYVLAVDLDKVIVSLFSGSSITVDPITKAVDGKVAVYIDCFADWDTMPNAMTLAKVG